jgi:hypothetical protein
MGQEGRAPRYRHRRATPTRPCLQRFIGHAELQPLQANNAEDLVKYIRWASTAVLQAASSPASQTQAAPAGVNVPLPPVPPASITANDVW